MADELTRLVDVEAEEGVLGALLLGASPATIQTARDLLPVPDCFSDPARRHAFTAMCALLDRGIPLDPLTVRDELQRLGLPVDLDALAAYADTVPTSANLTFHAKIVHDRYLRRELARIGQASIQRAEALTVGVEDGFVESVTALIAAAAPTLAKAARPLKDALHPALERLAAKGDHALDPGAVSTGLDDLDEILGGLAPKRLVVVAARPKKGKTALALQIGRHAAALGPVYHVSLEMGEDELAGRLLTAEAEVGGRRRYTDRELSQLAAAAGRLAPLAYIVDTHADTPGMIRLAVQAQMAQGRKPALVIVDYLQLLRWPGKTENRNVEVGKLTRALKRDVAMALDVPVLLLSQLSRASVEGGKERAPVLSDLRDSGNIEQDADQVVMLHYAGPESGTGRSEPWGEATRTELYVRGNRHGPGGHFDVYYDRGTGRWRGMSRYDHQEAA